MNESASDGLTKRGADEKDVYMWCESMNAKCGGGADGYHDDGSRRNRSVERWAEPAHQHLRVFVTSPLSE